MIKTTRSSKSSVESKKEEEPKTFNFNGRIYNTEKGLKIAKTKYYKNKLIDLNKILLDLNNIKKKTRKIKDEIKKIQEEIKKNQEEQNKYEKIKKIEQEIKRKERGIKRKEKKIQLNFKTLLVKRKNDIKENLIKADEKTEITLKFSDLWPGSQYNYVYNINQIKDFIKLTKTKNEKGKIFKHEVIYYDENGNQKTDKKFLVIDEETESKYINLSKEHNTFVFRVFDKTKKSEIYMAFNTHYEELWNVALYLNRNPEYRATIRTSIYRKIVYEIRDNKQIYKENNNGTCFYDGILQFFKNKQANKPHGSIKGIINKLINEQEIYKKAYTENEIQEFCKVFKISITIKDFVSGNDVVINESKFNKYNIEFINSKYNHLDLLVNSYDVKEVSKSEYDLKLLSAPFYIEKMGSLTVLENGINKTYKKEKSEFDLLHQGWLDKYNLNSKFIYTTSKEYELINGYDFSMHRIFNYDTYTTQEDYAEYDLRKAYYNCLNKNFNQFYIGVPSGSFINYKPKKYNIDDFNLQLENGLVGFFHIKITKTKKNLDVLGFKLNSIHILYSSMIKVLSKYVEFEFLNISISPSFDLEFGIDFLKTDKTGLSHYVKAFGILFKENTEMLIKIKPLDNDQNYYKTFFNNKYDVYETDGIYTVVNEYENPKSFKHIAYAIHSYTSTLILDELLKINNLDDVLGVKLDSVVIKKSNEHKFNKMLFKEKPAKIQGIFDMINDMEKNHNDLDFGCSNNDDDEIHNTFGIINNYKLEAEIDIDFEPLKFADCDNIYNKILFFGGSGGSGKTYSLMNSSIPKKNICYTTSSWDLIQDKKNEYPDIIGLSIPKLTGDADGKACVKISNPNIKYIAIDELTLTNKSVVEKIIELYPDVFIFAIGDINENGHSFQCKIYTDLYIPNEKTQYIEYKKTYRFDNELNERILKIRESQLKHSANIFKFRLHRNDCESIFADRFFKKEHISFNENDIGIISKNDNNQITNYFIKKGTKPKYFVKTTDLNRNVLRGQELNEKPNNSNYEMKLFKTIHSFQGRQLVNDSNQKIIIYWNSNFDYNLFYTAVSRARTISQIYIITE